MKANELRIGNYVIAIDNVFGEVFRIDHSEITMLYYPYTDIITFSQPTEVLKPIPLTEEWLVKFGFVNSVDKDGICYVKRHLSITLKAIIHDNNDLDLFIEIGYHIGFSAYPPNELFVHQLQNLYFALTGEELTIKDI